MRETCQLTLFPLLHFYLYLAPPTFLANTEIAKNFITSNHFTEH